MRIVCICLLLVFCLLSVTAFFAVYSDRNKNSFSYDVILPTILGEEAEFNAVKIRKEGRPHVINVFASWCTTCLSDHQTWMKIAEDISIDIYGIDYIDVESSALAWIREHGNPYVMIAADYSGKMSKSFGVSGVPETFVFNKSGELVLHVSGSVPAEFWKKNIPRLLQ